MLRFKFAATTAMAMVLATGASAASLDIESITASWSNFTTNIPTATVEQGQAVADNSGSTITLRWGETDLHEPDQSGYDFTSAGTPIQNIADGTVFELGTFSHLNFPIYDPFLTSTDLNLSFQIAGGPLVTSTFSIDHNETTNEHEISDCGFVTVTSCDDFVTISNLTGGSESFTLADGTYTFNVLGFSTDGGQTITSIFQTAEAAVSTAKLFGTYTVVPPVAPVPLPAAGWFLIAGLGGIAAMGRKKKKA